MKDILFSHKLAKKFNPLNKQTMDVERKLLSLEITSDGKIQGVTPIGGKEKTGIPNSAFKRVGNLNFLIAPVGQNTILVIDEA